MSNLSSEFLLQSLQTGFVDSQIASLSAYRPDLILNNPPHQKVLSALINELNTCTYFQFSVAFITVGGLMQLHQALLDACGRGVKGQILTSNYLNFTDPDALVSIQKKYPNIELKICIDESFHAKGYIFSHDNYSTIIVGSSNITASALATNREWNVRFHSLTQGEFIGKIHEEFFAVWNSSIELNEAWLLHYRRVREATKIERNITFATTANSVANSERNEIKPNRMQLDALKALSDLRSNGAKKGLLISATGTGKTYLSAFDVKVFQPKRFLFIVHRETVARKAMESYKDVFGIDYDCGFLGAGETTISDHVFSMIQTLAKDSVLHSFPSDYFDYIVIDEVHHAGGGSYSKVLNYFEPKFMLGMTATPERCDGFDIYALFDNNIAYEIRLNQALEADLLCPFHYFGVSDLTINGEMIEEKTEFNALVSDERVMRIHDTIEQYTLDTKEKRGLIFCSRVDETKELSDKLNLIGYRTQALCGADLESQRQAAIDSLSSESPDHLEYLLTVDILNEGVDIPCLNQIIMLRPTQSAIVFVQQLGRGLRKYPEKEFVTIIDFIGNYQNNFMVPIALFGDYSYEKDSIRRYLSGGSIGIPGVSTVDFDRISKERIYDSINHANFNKLKFLKQEYEKMKYKLGKIPTLMDYTKIDSISPQLFIDYSDSYYEFLTKVEKHVPVLPKEHTLSLRYLSKILSKGLRPCEYTILGLLLANAGTNVAISEIYQTIQQTVDGYRCNEPSLDSALRLLDGGFFRDRDRQLSGNISYCSKVGGGVHISKQFSRLLGNDNYKSYVMDLIEYSRYQFLQRDMTTYHKNDLFLYDKYTRQEVLLLLGWSEDMVALNIGGYVYQSDLNVCPIFVTYEKDVENIDPGINYKDRFISPEEFAWETKHGRTYLSPEVVAISSQAKNDIRVPLFVKKHDDEGSSFYYMGDIEFLRMEQTEKETGSQGLRPIVTVWFRMKDRVEEEIYHYLTNS